MTMRIPTCSSCKHFGNRDDNKKWFCKAYPDDEGIPIDLIWGGHFRPLLGQKNDFVFEEKEKTEESNIESVD